MMESARSGGGDTPGDAECININRLSQRRDSSTNQALNSIEQELQRHREVDSQRRLIAIKNHSTQQSQSNVSNH